MERAWSVLVTGAASGIGAAICRALARPGVAILVHTRTNRAGAAAVAQFGALDALVANAGFADRTPIADLDDAAMARSVEAIQGGFFRLARAAIPHLRQGRDARVVAVSSFVAHAFRVGVPSFPASAAAKAGLEALVRALALELGPAGVTVNAVVPGFIRKDAGAHVALDAAASARRDQHIPLGRIGLPEEVAAAVAFLLSKPAAYITGQALHVDGGLVM
jgi:3-oxoacyl-[acyl-carrier protein] reductase